MLYSNTRTTPRSEHNWLVSAATDVRSIPPGPLLSAFCAHTCQSPLWWRHESEGVKRFTPAVRHIHVKRSLTILLTPHLAKAATLYNLLTLAFLHKSRCLYLPAEWRRTAPTLAVTSCNSVRRAATFRSALIGFQHFDLRVQWGSLYSHSAHQLGSRKGTPWIAGSMKLEASHISYCRYQ